MKANRILSGITFGSVLVLIFASVLSIVQIPSSAQQQMQHQQHGQMTMGQAEQQMQHQQHGQMTMGQQHPGMFKASGMSMVNDVRITGVAIIGEQEATVLLRYTGNDTIAPAVGIFAMTNHESMMQGMMMGSRVGQHHQGMMTGQNQIPMTMPHDQGMEMIPRGNQSTAMMPAQYPHHSTGSNFIDSGWNATGTSVRILFDGDSLTYDTHDLHVMVVPYLQ